MGLLVAEINGGEIIMKPLSEIGGVRTLKTRKYVAILEQLFFCPKGGTVVSEPIEAAGRDAQVAFPGFRSTRRAVRGYRGTDRERPFKLRTAAGNICCL